MKILLVGAGPDIKLPKNVKEYFVCAVDGGYETCNKFGIIPNFYIGDKDSYSGQINCDSLTKDPHKDDSDMEIALNNFIKNSDEVYITWVLGGRLSHTIGILMLLARKDYSIVNNVKIYGDKKVVFSIIGKQYVEADFSKYKLFSMFSFTESTHINRLDGFEYNLENAILNQSSTLGLSNVPKGKKQKIDIEKGSIIVVLEEKE